MEAEWAEAEQSPDTEMKHTAAILERFDATIALDQRAKSIREATGCDLAESYERAIDGDDESSGDSRGDGA